MIPEEAIYKLLGTKAPAEFSEEKVWEQYYEDLLRLGLTTRECRQAIVAPGFSDFVPVGVTGKPASELIIEARGAR